MAVMMSAVANGGTVYKPWFVKRVESLDGAVVREYGPEQVRTVTFKPGTLDSVRNALADVVASPEGTGGAAKTPLVRIAGKTGTAQVTEMKGATVKSENLAYLVRDHAWFVSYAPADNPEIAVAVIVEHGGHGGSAAAPLAKKVIETYLASQGEIQLPPEKEAAEQKLARAPVVDDRAD
jgi:penicillin-binding protein 2